MVPVDGATNQFVVSIARKLLLVTWDGVSDKISDSELLIEVENKPGYFNNRFNDGKADPSGRLWAGTVTKIVLFSIH